MKTPAKPKEPVRLRQKPIAEGNASLYLDIYVNGKRSYEFLKLYLVQEKTKADKAANERTLSLANAVKAQRIVEVQGGKFGFGRDASDRIYLFDYIGHLIEEHEAHNGTPCTLRQMFWSVRLYERNDRITLAQVTPEWIKGYVDFLARCPNKNTGGLLKPNTQAVYFARLRSVIRRAYADRLISENPMRGLRGAKKEDVRRNYLTIEELGILARTECPREDVKRAFLFSCLTGLRWSDVVGLRWEDVSRQGKYTRIVFRQKKTGGQEYLDISGQAVDMLGERRESGAVFGTLPNDTNVWKNLDKWVKAAGINKHISFHCARHTFAVMMLDLGTDIYTVSKLLGHRELATTQVYAKVLDKNKQAAIDRIPDIISGEGKE